MIWWLVILLELWLVSSASKAFIDSTLTSTNGEGLPVFDLEL